MYLLQLLLPLYDNRGRRLPRPAFRDTARELTDKFRGLTAYSRAPAQGLWRPARGGTVRDDVIVYEVMARGLERRWWGAYRRTLAARFRQEAVVVRAMAVTLV